LPRIRKPEESWQLISQSRPRLAQSSTQRSTSQKQPQGSACRTACLLPCKAWRSILLISALAWHHSATSSSPTNPSNSEELPDSLKTLASSRMRALFLLRSCEQHSSCPSYARAASLN